MTPNFRPRVLLIAEAANPEWVSVPLVGWSLVRALAKVADVHVVTQVRNRDAFLRAGMVEGADFTAIDSEALARPLWKLGNFLSGGRGGWTIQQAVATISYPYFERLVWQRFGANIRAGHYDLVHRVTPLSPVQQSPIATKCRRAGVPFVLGPINGGVPWPKGFEAEMRREREWLSKVRGLYRALPGRQGTLRADAILCGSRQTMRDIPAAHQDRVIYLPENAIDPARFNATAVHGGHGPMRACFIGRLVPLKGVDMLIAAAAPLLRNGRLVLDIIGDGDMMEPLRAQAAPFGDAVVFHGWKDHAQVQDIAARCQVLAFPSIREFGGGVVLEAMALGLAPIVVDYAGPAELVTEDTGWKVPITGRNAVIAGLAARLAHCVDHPQDVAAKGALARARVDELFTWNRKAAQILRVYHWVLDPDSPKPNLFGQE
ncbi:MAG: glycosyltransferase family 4 protein [Pseudotabrizicola sp.]|uniref:glycosyltransferase family 4 protein n=1 Tax=Pseudotabrizicola sp. TaxID=2939647 RepID=UPI00272FC74F|nr:glycosyltransferase family 4 protein [Pseudotabrizicola sp.]MDP2081862.1 glycosyltransferase family 4 protein [Pseudotabrizicola sp.]MDZ7573848.1 glycosyltransferase family 4 protein [Pseudotabrizicola sp.]